MILHTLWPNSVPSLRPDAPWIEERKKALNRLHTVLTARQTDVEEALKKDLGRCRMESVLCESVLLFDKLKTALTSVEAWARPELVLPILSCPSLDEAIRHINSRAPLAPYLFSKSREEADRYGPHCHFGGDCVNDTFSRLISTQGSPLAEWAKAAWAAPTAAGASSPFPTKKASCGALHCGYSPALSALCRQGLGVEPALAPGGLGHNLPGAERLRKALHSQGTAQGVPASPSLRCPTLNYEKNHKTKERCISNSYNKKKSKINDIVKIVTKLFLTV